MKGDKTVAVIGGGAGGCGSSLALAERGWKVHLFEKNTIFSGTSGITCGRLGLGFHYIDLETSLKLMRATIRLVKTFPGHFVGEDFPSSHPIRRGRYFITNDSLASPHDILEQAYSDMVDEDPSNMVFGLPKDFYRILDKEEYVDDVDVSKVVVGIETSEHLLDCKKFQTSLESRLRNHNNITIHEFTKLVDIERLIDDKKYRWSLIFDKSDGKRCVSFSCDYVVNSTWCQIEKFNRIAGFPEQSFPITNRLKAIVGVKLPVSMYDSHSMFFCIGPFCMFSNLGDGTALMTYAPVTNITTSDGTTVNKKMARLTEHGATVNEFRNITSNVVNGVSTFIPALKNAEVISLAFGIVKTQGSVDIYDLSSPFHRRSYFAVRSEGDGWTLILA
ncbi:uncharacterized protein LOC124442691 [Xenia sp. Carnegie-2017]|uniref:uncharacterized protein LOC124442691 n=1 Tax=Xenia sp. Carnegie-2017 TaxID=2897299 RepID=UPI001F04E85B|nr:uncharacterized protein LOC124442691 [Xenia sp. Carnegie-2017]